MGYAAYGYSCGSPDMGADGCCTDRYVVLIVDIDDVDMSWANVPSYREETYCRVEASGADAWRRHTVGCVVVSVGTGWAKGNRKKSLVLLPLVCIDWRVVFLLC